MARRLVSDSFSLFISFAVCMCSVQFQARVDVLSGFPIFAHRVRPGRVEEGRGLQRLGRIEAPRLGGIVLMTNRLQVGIAKRGAESQ